MTVNIDSASGTCSAEQNGTTYRSAIADVRVTTDPAARMSVAHMAGISLHVAEDQAEHLIAAGAKDERENIIVDD